MKAIEITPEVVKAGLFIVFAGKRWSVSGVRADGPMIRINMTRPWTGERSSGLFYPNDQVTLDRQQG